MKYYKQQEIHDYSIERLKELVDWDKDYLNKDITDIHNELFNTDYYIIGTYEAKQWLMDYSFDVIGIIKEYEQENFGNVSTDLSCPEKVVNMYLYIVGEAILDDCISEINKYILPTSAKR